MYEYACVVRVLFEKERNGKVVLFRGRVLKHFQWRHVLWMREVLREVGIHPRSSPGRRERDLSGPKVGRETDGQRNPVGSTLFVPRWPK